MFFYIYLEREIIPIKTLAPKDFFLNFRFLMWKRLLKYIIKRNITMIIYIDRLALNLCMFQKDIKGKLLSYIKKNCLQCEVKRTIIGLKKGAKDMKQYQKKIQLTFWANVFVRYRCSSTTVYLHIGLCFPSFLTHAVKQLSVNFPQIWECQPKIGRSHFKLRLFRVQGALVSLSC